MEQLFANYGIEIVVGMIASVLIVIAAKNLYILVTLREIKTMDKGLFIGLIVSAGAFIVFLI
jgi:FtsH-binding integral membrane protein